MAPYKLSYIEIFQGYYILKERSYCLRNSLVPQDFYVTMFKGKTDNECA